MTTTNNFWVLRQNYGSKTNQFEMKDLILKLNSKDESEMMKQIFYDQEL